MPAGALSSVKRSLSITSCEKAMVARSSALILTLIGLVSGCSVDRPPVLPSGAFVAVINASSADDRIWDNNYCAGVLVAKNAVATATHCVDSGPLPDVVVGAMNLCTDQGERRHVKNAIFGDGEALELTLLVLEDPVKADYAITARESVSSDLVATGWGRTAVNAPRKCDSKLVSLTSTPGSDCEATLRAATASSAAPKSTVCLQANGETNTCIGDSGGGAYDVVGGDLRVHGITLGGLGCTTAEPGLYAGPRAIDALLTQAALEPLSLPN
ncbi:S1 family peptidase [Demequina aurantiaca]|uniref:S1 family peptidase n=1 Tax=Demequina aurantiaca TaxID=676200 RepID=UPI003D33F8E5